MEKLKDRTLEVAICIESVIILILITLVVHFITTSVSLDLNKDGQIDVTDLLISNDKTLAIRDYILDNEN
jgi:hypothetical protein